MRTLSSAELRQVSLYCRARPTSRVLVKFSCPKRRSKVAQNGKICQNSQRNLQTESTMTARKGSFACPFAKSQQKLHNLCKFRPEGPYQNQNQNQTLEVGLTRQYQRSCCSGALLPLRGAALQACGGWLGHGVCHGKCEESFNDSWPPCELAHRDAGVHGDSRDHWQPVAWFPRSPVGARSAGRVATRSRLSQRARRLERR